MCDTVVATPEASADGVTLFAKNSDRDPNEAHHVISVPARDHPPGSELQCTYIRIPQVEHTHAVLLSKPFWIWGAEMGVNEHGVAIGNEAVFTKAPMDKEEKLIGMDLLRLGLERASTVREAVSVITDLLETHGQGGNCGFMSKIYYHNSFLVADPQEAWVLETADRHWAAKWVQGTYSISNRITITDTWDLASPDLVSYAVQRGWCKSEADFSFADCYNDFLYTTFCDSLARCNRTSALLDEQQGQVQLRSLPAVLRDHHRSPDRGYRPDRGIFGQDVCAHAGFGPVRISQTTGSFISHLHPRTPTHFATATSAPCTSLFKPLWVDAPLPEMGPEPEGTYNPDTLWWQHEEIHRATLLDFPARQEAYAPERDAMEAEFLEKAVAAADGPPEARGTFSAEAFAQASEAEARWLQAIQRIPKPKATSWHFSFAWNRFNRLAQMPDLA